MRYFIPWASLFQPLRLTQYIYVHIFRNYKLVSTVRKIMEFCTVKPNGYSKVRLLCRIFARWCVKHWCRVAKSDLTYCRIVSRITTIKSLNKQSVLSAARVKGVISERFSEFMTLACLPHTEFAKCRTKTDCLINIESEILAEFVLKPVMHFHKFIFCKMMYQTENIPWNSKTTERAFECFIFFI